MAMTAVVRSPKPSSMVSMPVSPSAPAVPMSPKSGFPHPSVVYSKPPASPPSASSNASPKLSFADVVAKSNILFPQHSRPLVRGVSAMAAGPAMCLPSPPQAALARLLDRSPATRMVRQRPVTTVDCGLVSSLSAISFRPVVSASGPHTSFFESQRRPGSTPSSGTDIKAGDASLLLCSGALMLDVRTPQEFTQGHIASSINVRVCMRGMYAWGVCV